MRGVAVLVAITLTVACGSAPTEPIYPELGPNEEVPPPPELDTDQVSRGATLYATHCAVCHRPDLSGDPLWQTPAPDGGYRPPPHDSTGHTWHHADQVLIDIVLVGYDFEVPESRMPQFAGILTADEVRAILEFFKSSWGPEERRHQWEQTLRYESD